MTDRELLELAAKAAGLDVEFMPLSGANLLTGPHAGLWRPLDDDGDALRLAVKLGLALYPPESKEDGATVSTPGPDGIWHVEDRTDDPFADMRRAIVRAAAAMAISSPLPSTET